MRGDRRGQKNKDDGRQGAGRDAELAEVNGHRKHDTANAQSRSLCRRLHAHEQVGHAHDPGACQKSEGGADDHQARR